MITYTPSFTKPVRPKKIRFAILSDEEIRRVSVAKITETTLYYRGLPNSGGMNDALMGTCDRRLLCGTCMKDIRMCQGHIGHIELAYPMYHIGFFENVLKTLRCVCFFCSRLCATDEELQSFDAVGKNRFVQVYMALKNRKKCPHCNMMRPNYVKASLNIRIEWPSDMEWESEDEYNYCNKLFTAREARSILQHVSDEDYRQLGYDPEHSHPKNMIQTTIVICPPVTRPAITQSEGSRSRGQNDLTHKYQDIQKKSLELATHIPDWRTKVVTPELHEKIQKLQFEVFTLVNNSVKGQKQSIQRSGMPTKSIIERLKGKDGRIRGNLMGKRVDFSARSVITPCSNMDIDHVGVPEKLALTLTVSERVTHNNMETLIKRVRKGAGNINGADSVILQDGTVYQLEHCKDLTSINLKVGDVCERYLQDDDIVVFNRQPSLHRMSMLGHRVKIMPGLTFRLNVVCTSPYNADFDGDEMNLHVPRSQTALSDVMTMMMVGQQIISPQSNKPCMGIVQDSLVGSHLLCQDHIFLDHLHACHACATVKYVAKTLGTPCIRVKGKPYWSGKKLLSMLLPCGMTIDLAKIQTLDDDLSQIVIRRGRMLCGSVTKSVLGASSGGIIDVFCRDFGNDKASEFMSDVQRLSNSYLLIRGFSVGVSDCILNEEGHKKVNERLEKATVLCEEISREMYQEETPEDVVRNAESTILKILSKTLMQTGSIVNDYVKDNSIQCMVNCKSKGTPINLSQILGLVGQQSVEGGRIVAEKGCRTLPYFGLKERSLASQGFVSNSYALGLLPTEFFFHAMGGREGLSDTAVKTSVTGYIQRRQIKSMEDHKVNYDKTVRDALNGIVEFVYGGDDMDPVKLERVKLGLLEEHPEHIRARMTDTEYEIAMKARSNLLSTRLYVNMPALDTRVLLPFHPLRILQMCEYTDVESEQIGQERALEMILQLIVKCDTNVLRAAILDYFCSSRVQTMVAKHFETLIYTVEQKMKKGIIHAGEMVGSLAAQSVGEPATQMSIRGDEHVLIRDNQGVRSMRICDVVDPLIDSGTPPCLQVMGVTPTGQVSWANVQGVSRHPANGPLLKVTTATGRCVVATASHSFLTKSAGGKVVPIRGDHLKIGAPVPIMKTYPPIEEEARLLGSQIARGYDHSRLKPEEGTLVEWLIDKSRCSAFLHGLLEVGENATVTVGQRYAPLVQIVCHFAGIVPDCIQMETYVKLIFDATQVSAWTDQILWDSVRTIEHLGNSNETVYDFTVEQGLQSFMLTNGLFVHNTLNTFHFAGCASKNVTLGIPRLKELLDVSKNPKTPSTTIRFKKPFSRDMEFVNYFANTLPLTRLGDVVSKCDIYHQDEQSQRPEDDWMDLSAKYMYSETHDTHSKYIARLLLNQAVMKTRHLTPPIVRRVLQQRLGERATVLSSEANDIEWVLRIRFARVSEMMKVVGMTSDREAVLCHRVVSTLLDTLALSGHPNVKSASIMEVHNEYLDADGVLMRENEYVVSTLGSCLLDCSASPCVDWVRTTSNDIVEIIELMGIEAAAAQLFEQLSTVVSFDGTYIDPRHLTIIVNTMCKGGGLMALNRHGINRSDTGPLGKCSFEETPDILHDAAMFAETDNAQGISTSIMTGQLARIGSGSSDILFHSRCFDPRQVHKEHKTLQKPWRSTCRCYTSTMRMEDIEYVDNVHDTKINQPELQKPFLDADELKESSDKEPSAKRMRFRPRSPTSEDL